MTPATPVRAGFVACVFGVLVAGCADAAPEPVPGAAVRTTTAPTSPPDPLTVCVGQLTYWAEQDLTGAPDPGYDYQHRGLTAAQANALRAIVGEAQALGPDRPPNFVAERVRSACDQID